MTVQKVGEVAGDRRAEQAQHILAELARELGPNSKLPTTRDLRKSMRISQATLDTALDGMELQGLIHRRHGSGVYVSPLIRLRRIAVVLAHGVFETRSETFDHVLFRAMRPVAKRHNCLVSYHFADLEHNEDEHGPHQLATDVQQGRVDALVIRGPLRNHSHELQSLAIPRVFVTSDKSATPRINLDGSAVIAKGVELLAQGGCKKLGLAYADYSGPGDREASVRRFKQALDAVGLPFHEKLLIPFKANSVAARPLEASSQFHQLWQNQSDRPDGLVSTDDQFTSGIVHACQLLRIQIPEQLMIATHANKGLELFAGAQVIRMEFDPVEVAGAILTTIDELLQPNAVVTQVRSVEPHFAVPAGMSRLILTPASVKTKSRRSAQAATATK